MMLSTMNLLAPKRWTHRDARDARKQRGCLIHGAAQSTAPAVRLDRPDGPGFPAAPAAAAALGRAGRCAGNGALPAVLAAKAHFGDQAGVPRGAATPQ